MFMFIKLKKIIAIGAACLILVGIGFVFKKDISSMAVAASATDWGVSYQEEGKTPIGNATADFLIQYDTVFSDESGEKNLYLTFDAGYENGNTKEILDVLLKHEVQAAFFLVGNYFKTSPDLVIRMQKEGHLVCNHTYSHPDMSKVSTLEAFEQELKKNEDLYREVTGAEMSKYYRPPMGRFSEQNLKHAKQLGYKTILWSLAYVDWHENDQPTKEHAFSRLVPRVHPGAIILLHSTSKTNAKILDELISKYKEMGYTFKSLDDLKFNT